MDMIQYWLGNAAKFFNSSDAIWGLRVEKKPSPRRGRKMSKNEVMPPTHTHKIESKKRERILLVNVCHVSLKSVLIGGKLTGVEVSIQLS